MPNNSSDVSAVICSWNAAESIAPCIQSLRNNGVKEIILVDASSTDGTRELAEPLVDQMLTDPRQGLGCLLYTSPSPRDRQKSRMPSSA